MLNKLVDISINEVSLVDKAANKKKFLIVKRASEGGEGMDMTGLEEAFGILKAGKKLSRANMDKLKGVHSQLSEFIDTNGSDDDDIGDDADDQNGGGSQMDEKAVKKMLDEQLAVLAKKHETEIATLTKRAEDAERIAKAEQDGRVEREFIAKAGGFDQLGIDPSDFGKVLKVLHEKAPEEAGKVMDVLKVANEMVKKGDLFKEIGGNNINADIQKQIDVKVADLQKADGTLSKEQALRKVYRDFPDLYRQARQGR